MPWCVPPLVQFLWNCLGFLDFLEVYFLCQIGFIICSNKFSISFSSSSPSGTPMIVAGETPSLTGEFVGETHRVLEHTQAHPPGNQHHKGPICLWVAGEMTESLLKDQQQHCSLSDLSPTHSVPTQRCGLPRPGEPGSAPGSIVRGALAPPLTMEQMH